MHKLDKLILKTYIKEKTLRAIESTLNNNNSDVASVEFTTEDGIPKPINRDYIKILQEFKNIKDKKSVDLDYFIITKATEQTICNQSETTPCEIKFTFRTQYTKSNLEKLTQK